jgi:hypothetical protein
VILRPRYAADSMDKDLVKRLNYGHGLDLAKEKIGEIKNSSLKALCMI